jgi:tRNA(fMet)-specific endonuclease VapC
MLDTCICSFIMREQPEAVRKRPDVILPWDRTAVDATTEIKVALRLAGTPIGPNDTAIAGHAIAAGAVLVTNNTREFERVPGWYWKTG